MNEKKKTGRWTLKMGEKIIDGSEDGQQTGLERNQPRTLKRAIKLLG
jgi:hypothetical protein